MESLNQNILDKYNKKYKKSENYNYLENSISNNSIDNVFINRSYLQKKNDKFNKKIYNVKHVTNQKKSGRCWLFSFTNLLRHKMINKYNLEGSFQLSQNYLFFYDKLEKSQFFMVNIYKNRKEKLNSPVLKYFLQSPTSDGGFWNMAVNLVEKYGVIPLENMNDSYQSGNTKKLNYFLNQNLKRFAREIINKNHNKKQFQDYLHDRLFTIYKLLCYFLGKPPNKFNWEYKDTKNNKVIIEKDLTPTSFYKKYININNDDYSILVNIPLPELPFYKKYKLKYCNNMVNGKEAICINLPMKLIKKYAKKSIDDKTPLWFGSDIEKYTDRKKGIASRNLYDYSLLYDQDVKELKKGDKVLYNQSKPNHAMLIIGYNSIKQGKVEKWLVENSWGSSAPSKGFMHIDDNWFSDYVFELVIENKYLDQTIIDITSYQKNIKTINPWDYFNCEALYVF